MTDIITEAPAEGPTPMYDSDHLLRRIGALDDERKARLAEAWAANNMGALEGLLTDEAYRFAERLVHTVEPTATLDGYPQVALADRLTALPSHIRDAATEALAVYAGVSPDQLRTLVLISTGRLAEAERIIGEAEAYAASLQQTSALAPVAGAVDQMQVAQGVGSSAVDRDQMVDVRTVGDVAGEREVHGTTAEPATLGADEVSKRDPLPGHPQPEVGTLSMVGTTELPRATGAAPLGQSNTTPPAGHADDITRGAPGNRGIPSVSDLPPADDAGDLAAGGDYPGPKAKEPEILAWVGTDKNRAARAYMHEQMDRKPRKGVTAKLIEVLGAEGLAKVTDALSAATPPPLDLGVTVPETPGATASDDSGPPHGSVESAAVAPANAEGVAIPTAKGEEVVERSVADALRVIAAGLSRIAEELARKAA